MEGARTKALSELLVKLPCDAKKSLIALPNMNKDIIRAGQNIKKVQTIQAKDLNVLDLLNHQYVVMPKSAIDVIVKTFAK